ncbi:CubicO group peptidase (beta-lactamase class C family) [Microbacterium terrae]|uniref:Beta-lactamase n=1 Tax=Microbacterium terrae TaxID=69369 RepID=A0A0M2H0G0_9MICO|nr:EstA family serine hydrolase [Microbacterium terrae]KJL37500.1 Beta-lactamase precursor [Microbacterium terrae]MBP1076329.1 CubicO group peptidase (beta-lactamase class C family) [Microbacterium terrae]GLJ97153.1 serine hydrolase [Microbacterium terrae]
MKPIGSRFLLGRADDRLAEVVEALDQALADDPHVAFQAAAFKDGIPILDVWSGRGMDEETVLVTHSTTKVTIGVVVGVLIERGLLDLDQRVADYWPEFAARGKQDVTVRQLLSHQAGLPQATPPLALTELLDDHIAAERLAATAPFWRPGTAFGYHGLTIGNLAAELVFRITGRTFQQFYESDVRAPYDIDFFLGLPEAEEGRRRDSFTAVKPAREAMELPPSLLGELMHYDLAGDPGNRPESWRFGHPAAFGTGTARGLARLLAAAVTGVDGGAPLLSRDTVDRIGEQHVRGVDQVLGITDRSFGIVFQKPYGARPFGGARSFGHDGAGGHLATIDPETGVAFGWTTVRGAWPGGADPRAVRTSRRIGTFFDTANNRS